MVFNPSIVWYRTPWYQLQFGTASLQREKPWERWQHGNVAIFRSNKAKGLSPAFLAIAQLPRDVNQTSLPHAHAADPFGKARKHSPLGRRSNSRGQLEGILESSFLADCIQCPIQLSASLGAFWMELCPFHPPSLVALKIFKNLRLPHHPAGSQFHHCQSADCSLPSGPGRYVDAKCINPDIMKHLTII